VAAALPSPPDRRVFIACVAVTAVAMALTAVAGVRWGAFAVGGSDSHCYAGQARMFAEGRVALAPPLLPPVPWPNAPDTFAPSGFAPGPGPDGGSVPLCPAGLSLAMAAAVRVAGDGALFAVVPLLGLLAVRSTWLLGRRLAGPVVGAASALLVACSPTFLYQLMQPMSDVPAAAFWTAALAAALGPDEHRQSGIRRGLAAGLLAGAAITIRPNLAPLAVIPVMLAWPSRVGAAATIGGTVPGIAAVALLQAAVYGAPWRSGYGDLGQLFSLGHIGTNLVNYPAWLALAHTPVLALGILAPLAGPRRRDAWVLLAFAAGVFAAYLPYTPFTDWWYTRFLLPALPALIVLMVTVLERASRRLPARAGLGALLVVTLALGGRWISRADELAVFRLKMLEQKYVELGRFASARLPPSAVVLAAQPAGSVRYYARLPTLSWDATDPAWLDRMVEECRARGLSPYLAVEAWEKDAFRERFRGQSPMADLDWPPRATLGSVIFVYDPADRDRYLAGQRVPTEHIMWGKR
jgi:Dolichyl-phosphate-mannose-protein mannosyltransferase